MIQKKPSPIAFVHSDAPMPISGQMHCKRYEIQPSALRRSIDHRAHRKWRCCYMTAPSHTPPRYLAQKNMHPTTLARAYSMLQSLAENERAQHCGTTVLPKLRSILHEEPASPYEKKQRRMQIAHMTRELQNRRKLAQLRDKYGTLQTEGGSGPAGPLVWHNDSGTDIGVERTGILELPPLAA